MMELQGAVGIAQLKKLKKIIEIQREIQKKYGIIYQIFLLSLKEENLVFHILLLTH